MSRSGPLLLAMARPLLPDYPTLSPDERRGIERELEDFLGAQVAGMPGYLRLGVQAALLAFALLPVLRFGRPYRALDASAQSRVLLAWDASPLGPMRDLVRLVKSCALFFYLDHPTVAARLEAESQGAGLSGASRAG